MRGVRQTDNMAICQDNMKERVNVTRATLPPLEEYTQKLAEIFASRQLTNQSENARELERRLSGFLDSPTLLACANGTLALQLAIRHLGLSGRKVITTPFTYVATVSALLWEGCEPVFADIDPGTFCLDPESVRAKLAEHSDAAGILPVHVFGNAADVKAIGEIAAEHDLKVLYDAAHAFGSRLDGRSLFGYGDAATGSFHSTKLFHTVEGGCVATGDAADSGPLQLLRAFGHVNDNHYCLGINAKMSELHAAMGLCLLPRVPELIRARAEKTNLYDQLLDFPANDCLRPVSLAPGLEWNHAYYPLVFANSKTLEKAMANLAKENIHPRRYFYPSLTRLPYLKPQQAPAADDIATRILCLPLWAEMENEIVERTTEIILKSI